MEDDQGDYVRIEMEVEESEAGKSFSLEHVVCNHGLFMMAPNLWNPSTKTFRRPLRLADSTSSLMVSINQLTSSSSSDHPRLLLLLRVHDTKCLSDPDKQAILSQVARMLRISTKDEKDVQEFHKLNPDAGKAGFGRLFRSPTIFEDAVKSILLCNCTWRRTLKMCDALCELQPELAYTNTSSSSSSSNREVVGNFPSAKEIASLSNVKVLERRCHLGYRAKHILKLAKNVESNRLKLKEFEQPQQQQQQLYAKLMKVKGFGPFACANLLMCIGFYQRIPQDSETIRHLSHFHARKNCNAASIQPILEEIYNKYEPFQCLAYWFELLGYYESKLGRLSELPRSDYGLATGSRLKI